MSTATPRVINTYDQVLHAPEGVPKIAIIASHGPGGDYRATGFAVHRWTDAGVQVKTAESGAPWYYHGRKTFLFGLDRSISHHERRRLTLAAAQKWIADQGWYAGEWARNGFGDYVPEAANRANPIKRPTRRRVE